MGTLPGAGPLDLGVPRSRGLRLQATCSRPLHGTLRATFVVDGPIGQTTGGYLYDRMVVDGLRAAGDDVDVLELPRGPSAAMVVARALSDATRTVVVDELCHPRAVLPSILPRRARLVTLVHHLAASERTGVRATARLAVERTLLARSDRVIVTSVATRDVGVGAGIEPARVWIAEPGCDRLGRRRAPPPPGDGRLRLLFLGMLTPRKDPLLLLHAFGAIASRARLTLVGPADRDARHAASVLVAATRSGALVTGTITDAELAALLSTHDALVLPSRFEGYGIALAEAMAHGLAIVATRAGAIPSVTGDAALLVEPGNASALSDALVTLTDPVRLAALQRASERRAAELPSWTDTVRAFRAALSW